VDQVLWKEVHHTPITSIRENIASFKLDKIKRKAREWRTALSNARQFLLEATGYYQSLLLTLCMAHGLRPVVQGLSFIELDHPMDPVADSDVHKSATKICYRLVTILGDLARYREQFHAKPTKNWTYAANLYREAIFLLPQDGYGHKQLAFLALYDMDHFTSIYHSLRRHAPLIGCVTVIVWCQSRPRPWPRTI
jgi:hypothetical protein